MKSSVYNLKKQLHPKLSEVGGETANLMIVLSQSERKIMRVIRS